MTINSSSQFCIPEFVILQLLGEESILLNLKTNVYYGLDPVGTRMVQTLEQVSTITQALPILLSEFDVTSAILSEDMTHLTQQLLEHGLLQEIAEGLE